MIQTTWHNRIVGTGEERPDNLLANPRNFRTHPKHQQDALEGVLNEVGWVDDVIVNRTTGHIIDGHLRVSLALRRNEPSVPVKYVELSDSEEALILATFDPIAALAVADKDLLESLLNDVSTSEAAVMQMLSEMAEREGAIDFDTTLPEPTPDKVTLADRFLVPPFTVLDARRGYWQERKRSWLALGIKSELGRGENALDMSAAMVGITDPEAVAAWNTQRRESPKHSNGSTIGAIPPNERDSMSRSGSYDARKVSPGGSPRPATRLGSDGKTQRGDGAGRPISSTGNGPARSFGQDLMRGEHVVGVLFKSDSGRDPDFYNQKRAAEARLCRELTTEEFHRDHYVNEKNGGLSGSGTSVFDPVLCELAYRWFSPPTGKVLDPFAGGSVRGIVAAKLGRSYTGIDLSDRQVGANYVQGGEIVPENCPEWHIGDSRHVRSIVGEQVFDFIFSCPPYADLEVYSDHPDDLSTMPYADFLIAYRHIIAASVERLANDRFACFVVGDVRDNKGIYRNFVSHTIQAFEDAGARLYNEAILVTAVGSLPIRVGRQFEAGRKLGKTHQNVLVFVKGDPKRATENVGPVDVADVFDDVEVA